MAVTFRAPVLAWAVSPDDEGPLKRILRRVLGAKPRRPLLALPWLPVMQPDRSQPQELPPRLARLIIEREMVPLPPPPAPGGQARAGEAGGGRRRRPPSRRPKPRQEPAPKPLPVPEARNLQPDKPPGEVSTDAARRKAAGVGLLAMSSELAEIRGAPLAVQLRTDIKQGLGVAQALTGRRRRDRGRPAEPGADHLQRDRRQRRHQHRGVQPRHRRRRPAGRATTLVEGVAGGGGVAAGRRRLRRQGRRHGHGWHRRWRHAAARR